MCINLESDYAIRILCYLAVNDKIVEAKEISEETNVSLRFALKILRKLTGANVIESFKGRNGGYTFSKNPKDVSLKSIVEIIEGPILICKCLTADYECNDSKEKFCKVRIVLGKISKNISEELSSVSIADVL